MKKFLRFLIFLSLLSACSGIAPNPEARSSAIAPIAPPQNTVTTPTSQPSNVPTFQHIFIIIFENKDQSEMLANPYFADLAKRGTFLSQYYGVAHPSQPNYLAMVGGDTFAIVDDFNHNLPQNNLVDLMEASGISWKTYQENYPGACFAGGSASALYTRKHNPFISFDNIRTNPARCAKIVNATELAGDIASNRLPIFSFYTPNANNDMHDQPISFGANWLKDFLEPKLLDPNFYTGTLVVITSDESRNFGSNPASVPIYTVLLGQMVRVGSTDSTRYTHYSLLRTIENNFRLGTLNRNDASAIPFAACNFGDGCK